MSSGTATGQPNPLLKARRIQYRVGHGGFHATIVTPTAPGSFQPLVYVYDVGADPAVAMLEPAIDDFVALLVAEKISAVQFVICSHIDADHVNRLDYLLRLLRTHSISVEKLLIPWLDELSRLYAIARTRHQPSTVVSQLLQPPAAVVQYAASLGAEEVVFVVPSDDDSDDEDDEREPIESAPSPNGKAVHGTYLQSGIVSIPPGVVPWSLVVSRLAPPKKTLRLFRQLVRSKTHLDPSDPASHATLVRPSPRSSTGRQTQPGYRTELRSAMSSAAKRTGLRFGKATLTNWSTLTLYGASTEPFARHPVPQAPNDFEWDCPHGWLHTGDFPVNQPEAWKAIKKAWRKGFGKVKTCAVIAPHHGSSETHNPALYRRFRPSAVIFTFGLLRTSTRGNPKYAKLLKPRPAVRFVRTSTRAKVRILNNR